MDIAQGIPIAADTPICNEDRTATVAWYRFWLSLWQALGGPQLVDVADLELVSLVSLVEQAGAGLGAEAAFDSDLAKLSIAAATSSSAKPLSRMDILGFVSNLLLQWPKPPRPQPPTVINPPVATYAWADGFVIVGGTAAALGGIVTATLKRGPVISVCIFYQNFTNTNSDYVTTIPIAKGDLLSPGAGVVQFTFYPSPGG